MRASGRHDDARTRVMSTAQARLPNFLIIGAMKAGTTSLYRYLRDHPQIFMPEVKELNFFNPHRNWHRGTEWYRSRFEGADDGVVAIGEASTSYTKYPWVRDAPERIAEVLGDVRLIYVVRDPIERMRSHYLHNVVTGQERRPIALAFEREPMYLNVSRYATQIEQYAPYFSRSRIMLIDSRHLRDARAETVRRVFEFLDVDPSWVPENLDEEFLRSTDRRLNPSPLRQLRRVPRIRTMASYVPAPIKALKRRMTAGWEASGRLDVSSANISEELRDHLHTALGDDVRRLRPYLGEDFDGWHIA
jgi:Sulfotransferase domain